MRCISIHTRQRIILYRILFNKERCKSTSQTILLLGQMCHLEWEVNITEQQIIKNPLQGRDSAKTILYLAMEFVIVSSNLSRCQQNKVKWAGLARDAKL